MESEQQNEDVPITKRYICIQNQRYFLFAQNLEMMYPPKNANLIFFNYK